MAATKKSTRQKKANTQPVKKNDSLSTKFQIKPSVAASKAQNKIILEHWNKNRSPRDSGSKKHGMPKSMRPLGGLQVYEPVDPYKSNERSLFRLILKMVPQINRSNKLIQKLVATEYTTTILPRMDKEVKDEALAKWLKTKINVPLLGKKMTPSQIKEFVDRLMIKLDLQQLTFNAYLFMREQGRCVIGMFPEERDEAGDYVLPEAMRLIRPEYTRRPIINRATGALEAVEVIGLSTNGGRLDSKRAIYFTNQDNLDLFADFYGVSEIEPLTDVGQVLLTIYAQDMRQATLHTWWQPKIFKMTIPARNADNPNAVMDEFLVNMRDAGGKDIVLTQTVELVSGTGTSNSGDLEGIVRIETTAVETVTGFYNIPAFLLSKGKSGTLGGNANREELDAFLNIEIRPEQVNLENIIEAQVYDIILAILFDVEPQFVNDPMKVPVRMEHHFKKPDIAAAVNLEQWEIAKDMASLDLISMEKLAEKFGLGDVMKKTNARGGDFTPSIKTWVKRNVNWNPQPTKHTKFKPSKNKMQLGPGRIEISDEGFRT